MDKSLQLKTANIIAAAGLARKGYESVALADDVLLVISPKAKDGAGRRLVAQVVIHPCLTDDEAKTGHSFSSSNTVVDLPVYTFSFVSLDDTESAYVHRELADLLSFGANDSLKLHIVD